jgi:RecB family exonuclease
MKTSAGNPWIKSFLTETPVSRKLISPSALGGKDSCLLRYALSSLGDEFVKYTPPTYFNSWGNVYHALREKAFTKQRYDAILAQELLVEDKTNEKDWLRKRLVPLANLRPVKEKIAIDHKRNRAILPEMESSVRSERISEYIREKVFPETGIKSKLPFRGRIDCIVPWHDGSYIIRDYKSGSVFEPKKLGTIKEAYIRQLHAYALLTEENYGLLPKRMELIDERGLTHVVSYNETTAREVLDEAYKKIALIDDVLRSFVAGAGTQRFCTVLDECCEYCQVKPYCSAYWTEAQGIKFSNVYSADITGDIISVFQGYSPYKTAVLQLKVGNSRVISLLFAKHMIETHPILSDWISGKIPHGTRIYILSAKPARSRTQFELKDDTVICMDS